MAEYGNKKGLVVSDQEIDRLDAMMVNFNSNISASMSYVRRAQGLTFKQLEKRFSGIQGNTLKRYMHQSYPAMRPLHVVAAYSWITMIPMTAFFDGFKQNKRYRGMSDNLIEALVHVGRLPIEMLNTFLTMACNMLNDESKQEYLLFRQQIESKYGKMKDHSHLSPPDKLDLDVFAIDYYRSVAITVKKFREENNLSIETISRTLGLSRYQYNILENPNKINQFPVSIGFRVMRGFQLNSYDKFTSEMKYFPEFHEVRKVQHVQYIRETLVIEVLRRLEEKERKSMVMILIILLDKYR